MPRSDHRAILFLDMPVLIVPKVVSYIADDTSKKIPPMTGPKSVAALEDWFSSGWRVHSASGFSQRAATVSEGAGCVDRAILVLEHD